jgi:hypothetical protein
MIHHQTRLALAAAALLCLASPAQAAQPTQAQADAIRQSCRADYQRHCSGVPTGGQAALSCLQQNAASVSPPCQQSLAALDGPSAPGASPPASSTAPPAAATTAAPPAPPMSPRQEMAVLRTDCGSDYRAFCSDVALGQGRAIACLRAHGPQLSGQCRSALLAPGK